MDRRSFLGVLLAPMALQSLRSSRKKNTDPHATSRYIYSQALRRAKEEHWNELSMGDLVAKTGSLFVGTPYVGGTLEGDGPEVCRVDLTGLDCVTLFESALAIARVIKKRGSTWDDLVREVTTTRYRNGTLDGYTSRLHYTSDWIDDNVRKSVVADVTQGLGGVLFPVQVNFMSENPKYYKPLTTDSSLVSVMSAIERRLGTTTRYYIPKDAIAQVEEYIESGDIIAITTSKAGLDYSHTGIAIREGNTTRLMHASSQKKKVILDGRISDYVQSVRSHTGITVVRPLSPK